MALFFRDVSESYRTSDYAVPFQCLGHCVISTQVVLHILARLKVKLK